MIDMIEPKEVLVRICGVSTLRATISAGLLLGVPAVSHAQTPPDWDNVAFDNLAFRYDAPTLTPLSGSDSAPTSVTSGSVLPRDVLIDEAAAALGHDVDRIYEYVHNQIRTTPTFGLSKGAFGAMLDEAGNPFDQAQLMVELLRSSDALAGTAYAPAYEYGDIALTGAAFEATFGVSTARGACELLAGGGIPAEVNSVGTDDCQSSAYDGALVSVEMRHVWVSAAIDGQRYAFDPSLKAQLWETPSGAVLGAVSSAGTVRNSVSATVGSVAGTPSVPSYSGFDIPALRALLTSDAPNVHDALVLEETGQETAFASQAHERAVTTHEPMSMQAVTGGYAGILPELVFADGLALRQSAHPLASTVHASGLAEIPDTLRTYVHFALAAESGVPPETLSFAAAELAGRQIGFVGTNDYWHTVTTSIDLRMTIDQRVVATVSEQCTWPCNAAASAHTTVGVVIDHPYFGGTTGASRADSAYSWNIPAGTPSFLVLGFGERGNGAEQRNARAVSLAGTISWFPQLPCNAGDPECQPMPDHEDYLYFSAMGATIMSIAEGYLTQSSAMLDIYEGAAGGRRAVHHVVGMAGSRFVASAAGKNAAWGDNYMGADAERAVYISVAGRSGYARIDAQSRSRESFSFASALALSALEQTLIRSTTDAPSVNGAASMFEWFLSRTSIAQAYDATETSNPDLAIRLLEFTPSNRSYAPGLMWGRTQDQEGDLDNGMTVVQPQSGLVGPARDPVRAGMSFYNTACSLCSIDDLDPASYGAGGLRNSTRVGYRIDADGSILVAPIANGNEKGGGGANFPNEIQAPATDREGIDEAFESWATAFSIDERTGGLTLTPPADIVTGAGDVPFSLEFQRTYSSDMDRDIGLGAGWTHNYDVVLETGTDIAAALGDRTPHQALATIIAAEATLDLFDTSSDTSLDVAIALLIQNWWSDTVFDNRARIRRGASNEDFILQPHGAWQPDPGSNAQLTRTGERTAMARYHEADDHTSSFYVVIVSEGFNRRNWAFSYISDLGVHEAFTHIYADNVRPGENAPQGRGYSAHLGSLSNEFLRRYSEHPSGIRLDYTYLVEPAAPTGTQQRYSQIASVTSNAPFSRELEFSYVSNPAVHPPHYNPRGPRIGRTPIDYVLSAVSDGDGQGVSFSRSNGELVFTNLVGEDARYVYDSFAFDGFDSSGGLTGIAVTGMWIGATRLTEIYLPTDTTTPFLSFDYDRHARLSTLTNARGQTWSYYTGSRARRVDPIGWTSWSYYDRDGRGFASVDPADRVVVNHFDAWGRTVYSDLGSGSQFPNLRVDRQEQYYDAYGNTVLTRLLPRTNGVGSAYAGTPVETVTVFGYTPFPTLPTLQIDPAGEESLTCYEPGQSDPAGLGRCAQVQALGAGGPDGFARGQFGPSGETELIEYDSHGRISRTRTLVED